MIARTSAVVVLLCAMFAPNAPYAAAPEAQAGGNCAAEIDRADRDLKEFSRELKKNNIDFISTDVTGASLTDIKSTLSGKPDEVITSRVQEIKQQIDGWVETAKNYQVAMDDILACLNTKGCSMTALANRQNAALARWIKSLGDEGITAASERVKEASSILKSYNNRALNMATGTMTRAANCIADKTQAASTTAAPVDLRGTAAPQPASSTPSNPGGRGPSVGKAIVGVAVGAAGVAGGIIYGSQLLNSLSEDAGGCGAEPVLDFSACFSGQASGASCTSNLAKLEAYCQSCGQKRGMNASATTCVPR